jgi:hypothetical protein
MLSDMAQIALDCRLIYGIESGPSIVAARAFPSQNLAIGTRALTVIMIFASPVRCFAIILLNLTGTRFWSACLKSRMMGAVVFSTTDYGGSRRNEFRRMLASLRRQEDDAGPVRGFVLLQNCNGTALDEVRDWAPAGCVLACSPRRLSLSAARNRLLKIALGKGAIGSDDIVGFPDDDCWYPDHFLARMSAVLRERPELGVLICGSSPDPEVAAFDARAIAVASTKQIVRKTSSNTMFFRGSLLYHIGMFDASIGVGTSRPGGEDIDYAIRGFLLAKAAGIIDRPLVGHPIWARTALANYFTGSLIVLARHAHSSPSLLREFVRKLLVGAWLVCGGKIPWQAFASALGETVTELSRAKRNRQGLALRYRGFGQAAPSLNAKPPQKRITKFSKRTK